VRNHASGRRMPQDAPAPCGRLPGHPGATDAAGGILARVASRRPRAPGDHLAGTYRVRILRAAFDDARALFPRKRDAIRLRPHALALRDWPAKDAIDWTWVLAMRGHGVGELRIRETIGDCDNLRLIFLVGPDDVRDPLPMIWVLAALQKKRDAFTQANIDGFWKRVRMLPTEISGRQKINE